MTDHAHELRRYARKIAHPAGDVPAVMRAAADEIERLRADNEVLASNLRGKHAITGATYAHLVAERDALRAEIKRMCERALPMGAKLYALPGALPTTSVPAVTATAYRWRYRGAIMWQYGELTEENARLAEEHNHEVQPLYAEPISARSAPSIRPAALFPVIAWLRNGCDPMKAADELEMLVAVPEAKS